MGAVNISDDRAGKMLMLSSAAKTAIVMNSKGQPNDQKSRDPFERLRELLSKNRDAKENQFEPLGEKEINGKQATGFRFDSAAALITLWGDAATGYPVRIEAVWSGTPRSEVVMTDFEINVELKESLFDLTPPADYKVQSFDVDVSKPEEQDLVNAFKLCGDISNGEFPDTLSLVGRLLFITKHTKTRWKNPSDDEMQQLAKQIGSISRGFEFASGLPESADAHYAGKGVKQGTVDRSIFWYKSEDSKKYRVIYADLSVTDADQPPQVSGAERLGKTGKTSKPAEK
jgi:hypothetical protein